jgi:hypothetical protein
MHVRVWACLLALLCSGLARAGGDVIFGGHTAGFEARYFVPTSDNEGGAFPDPGHVRAQPHQHRAVPRQQLRGLDRPAGRHPAHAGARLSRHAGRIAGAALARAKPAHGPLVPHRRARAGPAASAHGLRAVPGARRLRSRRLAQRRSFRRGRILGHPRAQCLRQLPHLARGGDQVADDGAISQPLAQPQGQHRRYSAARRELCARDHAAVHHRPGRARPTTSRPSSTAWASRCRRTCSRT